MVNGADDVLNLILFDSEANYHKDLIHVMEHSKTIILNAPCVHLCIHDQDHLCTCIAGFLFVLSQCFYHIFLLFLFK